MSSAGDEPKAAGSLPSATSATSAPPGKQPKPGKEFGFPKSARLLKRGEFRRVYDQGSRVTSSSFALFFAARPTDPGRPRIGFTTPRAVGNSVVRNRIKRRLREAIRLELPHLAAAVDYVFHPRRPILTVEFPQLRREIQRIFRKCESAVTSS